MCCPQCQVIIIISVLVFYWQGARCASVQQANVDVPIKVPSTAMTVPRDPCFLHHTVVKVNAHTASKNGGGGGAPLVLIHGLLGSSRNLKSWGELVLNHLGGLCHEAIFLDVVNHGGSVKHGPILMDYESMSRDVTYTLGKLGVNACHLIGHSLGGKVAAATALTSSSGEGELDIKSLTLLDISPVAYSQQDFSTVVSTVNFLVQTKSEIAKSVSKRDVSKILAREIHDPSLAAFLLSSIGDVVCPVPPKNELSDSPAPDSNEVCAPSKQLGWKFLLDGIEPSIENVMNFPFGPLTSGEGIGGSSAFRSFNRPTLVYKGANSQFVKSRHLPILGSLFPSYFLLTEKNCGHWLHHEAPDETSQKVASFVKTVVQSSQTSQELSSDSR